MAFIRYSQLLLAPGDFTFDGRVSTSFRLFPIEADDTPDRSQDFFIYWWGELQGEGAMRMTFYTTFGDMPWEDIERFEHEAYGSEGGLPPLRRSDFKMLPAVAPFIKVDAELVDLTNPYKAMARICSDAPFRAVPVNL